MNDIKEKVDRCFRNVFPDLRAEDLPRASSSSIAAWDSMAQVNLLSTISEECGVDFELEDFDQLVSYALILDHLDNKLHNG
jgi:acyl carrier protein